MVLSIVRTTGLIIVGLADVTVHCDCHSDQNKAVETGHAKTQKGTSVKIASQGNYELSCVWSQLA